MKSVIALIISIVICLVNVTSSQSLYSITSNVQLPSQSNQILNIIDVTTGATTNNFNMKLPYTVISILSVNKATNTMYLLCTDEQINSLLVEYTVSTQEYNTISTIAASQYKLSPSSQVKFVDKTAFVVLGGNSTLGQIDILSLNFANEEAEVIQLNAPNYNANVPITMGYDYEFGLMIIGYSTSNQVNLITLNATSPNANTTSIVSQNIPSVGTYVNMVFASNGNIYAFTDATIMPGFYSVCQISLSTMTTNCTPLANIGTGPYPFVPYFISGDYQSLITTGVSQFTPNTLSVSSYNINTNFASASWNVNNPFTQNNFEYQIWVTFALF